MLFLCQERPLLCLHSVLTAFWQFMSASILNFLTQRGCSASEQIPNETWDEKLFHDENIFYLLYKLWIAPVYLLKKCVFILTHMSELPKKLKPSFEQLPLT